MGHVQKWAKKWVSRTGVTVTRVPHRSHLADRHRAIAGPVKFGKNHFKFGQFIGTKLIRHCVLDDGLSLSSAAAA
jgi:hypothetical protein